MGDFKYVFDYFYAKYTLNDDLKFITINDKSSSEDIEKLLKLAEENNLISNLESMTEYKRIRND